MWLSWNDILGKKFIFKGIYYSNQSKTDIHLYWWHGTWSDLKNILRNLHYVNSGFITLYKLCENVDIPYSDIKKLTCKDPYLLRTTSGDKSKPNSVKSLR